jgi:hypothetical protein
MRNPISLCPVCDGQLEPVKLQCGSCDLTVEGKFPITRLGLLGGDQQRFVEAFLVARGNIKEVERDLGISYPTVRKRLEEVVQALGYASESGRLEQQEILDAIDRGDLSPQEGIKMMKDARKA